MIDGQTVMQAFECLCPADRQFIRDDAARRGLSIMDAMLEQCLSGMQQQLYSLRYPARNRGLRRVK